MTLTGNNAITLRKLTSKVTAEKGIPLKGVLHLLPKISMFLCSYLKIINNFLKNKLCIL